MQKSSFVCAAWLLGAGLLTVSADSPVGYTDTPIIPGQKWRVHDPDRPQPRVVTPAPTFSHNAGAPSDAIVLFDGTDLSKWQTDKGTPARWKVVQPAEAKKTFRREANKGAQLLVSKPQEVKLARVNQEPGYLEVTPKAGGIRTRDEFEDFQLHVEFAAPEVVKGNSQGRGNSGIFLLGQFEVQVLDCYQNITYPDGQLGAMYGQFAPLANPAKKPGEWQSYDVIFEAPRWDAEGKLIEKAAVTVIVNGVVLQHRKEYLGPSRHKENTSYDGMKSSRGPIGLQDHGDLVRFRNIWIRPLGEMDKP